MKISILETGNFKLDGGAIFGVVPKSLWSKQYPADENNLCNMSLRCLLIESGDRRILVDTGLGSKQDERFFGYYFLNGEASLDDSLKKAGLSKEDITDVIHTHLHFDHCGGSVFRSADGGLQLYFPKARHFVSKAQWEWTLHPNARERASFLKENVIPLMESGKLSLIPTEGWFMDGLELKIFNGHTEGLLVPVLHNGNKKFAFTADLLPFMAHIPVSWVCGYDTRPLISMEEKEKFLELAWQEEYILLFQHDLYHQACTVEKTDKGIRMKKEFSFSESGIHHLS